MVKLNPFAKNNPLFCNEICNFNEIGYKLANTQGNLTTVQKLFLAHAYPIYQKIQKNLEKGKNPLSNLESESTHDDSFNNRYKARLEHNRKLQREYLKNKRG